MKIKEITGIVLQFTVEQVKCICCETATVYAYILPSTNCFVLENYFTNKAPFKQIEKKSKQKRNKSTQGAKNYKNSINLT